MRNHRVCENENGKYKLQKRVSILKIIYYWSDYGTFGSYIYGPPTHKTTIYNTKKEALLSLEKIIDDELLETKSSTWQCTEVL